LNEFQIAGHLFLHNENKEIDEMECTGENQYRPNTVNKCNVLIQGRVKSIGKNVYHWQALQFFLKFFTPLRWFYFLLHITITIINCNSSTSDVGGHLLPRLSE
jgi:hypothetical protein